MLKKRALKDQIDHLNKVEPTIENKIREISLTSKLRSIELDEESFWKEKSCVEWLKKGDLNTKKFHLSTIIRRKANSISRVHNSNSDWVTERD